jgi:hypothetical protein
MAIDNFDDIRHLTVSVGAIISTMIGIWLLVKVNFFMGRENRNERIVVLTGGAIFLFNGLGSLVYAILFFQDRMFYLISVSEDLWTLAHISILAFALYYTLYFETGSIRKAGGPDLPRPPPRRVFGFLYILFGIVLISLLIFRRVDFRDLVYYDFYHLVIGALALLFISKWYSLRHDPMARLRCSVIFFAFVLHQVTVVKVPDFFRFEIYLYGNEFWMWSWHVVYFLAFIVLVGCILFYPTKVDSNTKGFIRLEKVVALVAVGVYIMTLILPPEIGGPMYTMIWVLLRPILFLTAILYANMLNLSIPKEIVNLFIALLIIELIVNVIDENLLSEGLFMSMVMSAVVGTSRFVVKGTRRVLVRFGQRLGRQMTKVVKEASLDLAGDKVGRRALGIASGGGLKVDILKAFIVAVINVLAINGFLALNMDFAPYLAAALAFGFMPVIDQIYDILVPSGGAPNKSPYRKRHPSRMNR